MCVHVLFFTKMTHVWVNFHEKGTFLGHFHEKWPRNVSFSWKLTQTCVIFVKNDTWTLMSYSWVTHEYSCVIFHGNENFFSHFSWKWELAFSFFTNMRTYFSYGNVTFFMLSEHPIAPYGFIDFFRSDALGHWFILSGYPIKLIRYSTPPLSFPFLYNFYIINRLGLYLTNSSSKMRIFWLKMITSSRFRTNENFFLISSQKGELFLIFSKREVFSHFRLKTRTFSDS